MRELTYGAEVTEAGPPQWLRIVAAMAVLTVTVVVLAIAVTVLSPWTLASILLLGVGAVALWVRIILSLADQTLDAVVEEI